LTIGVVVAAPFLAATLFTALAPELSKLVKSRVRLVLGSTTPAPTKQSGVPPLLSPEYIEDYIDYSIDAAQAVSALALPVVGVVFAVHQGLALPVVITLIVVGVPALLFALIRLLLVGPNEYAAKKFFFRRYTLVPAVGVVTNALATLIVFLLS